MLAAGLFEVWMLPPIMVFIGGWLFLGGYLFQKSLLKYAGERRISYGTGVLVSFLSGLVGAIPAMLVLWASMQLEGSAPARITYLIIGVAIAVILFAVVGYLVVFAMFKKLSAKTALSASLVPIVVIIALGGAVAVGCGIPAHFQKQKENTINRHVGKTRQKLLGIYGVLARRFPTNPPKTLDVLVEQERLSRKDITSPAKPDGKGFFYYPPVKILHQDKGHEKELLACDYTENFDGEYYVVVYTYGQPAFLGKYAFWDTLDMPINKKFAEAFRKADSK